MLCVKLEGWDGVGAGKEVQEGGGSRCVSVADVWQTPTQYCEAIIFHLKINMF